MAAVNSCGKPVTIKSQISHRAEGRNGNEFDEDLRDKLVFPPIFEEEKTEFPKNNNNQHHSSRFESQIEKPLTRQVHGTSLVKFSDVRFWPRGRHNVNSTSLKICKAYVLLWRSRQEVVLRCYC
jgi:hypothetical protein